MPISLLLTTYPQRRFALGVMGMSGIGDRHASVLADRFAWNTQIWRQRSGMWTAERQHPHGGSSSPISTLTVLPESGSYSRRQAVSYTHLRAHETVLDL